MKPKTNDGNKSNNNNNVNKITTNEKVITKYMLDCLRKEDLTILDSKYNWPIHFYN